LVFCPNAGCLQHSNPDQSLFIKKGKATGYKQKTYQRYLCKVCDTKFSDRKLQWDSPFRKKSKTGKKKKKIPKSVFTRKDTSREMCEAILETVQKCAGKNPHITTDEKKLIGL